VDLNWNNVGQGDYMIVATVIATSCSRDLNTVTVIENAVPVPNVTSSDADDKICEGTSVTLFAGDITGISWQWDNAADLNDDELQNPIATPTISTTYSVTVTDGNACTASGAITINVDASPTININDDQGNTFIICEGDDIILTGTSTNTIVNWNWSTGDATQSTTVAPTLTSPYTLNITDDNGCTNSQVQSVTVNDRPTANAGSDEIMCNGVGVTLTATATDGDGVYTYLWNTGDATDVAIVNPANNTTFTVTVTDGNNCNHSDDVNVTVVSNPTVAVAPEAGFSASICDGETTNLEASPAGGTGVYTYNWLPGGQSTDIISVSPPNAVLDAVPALFGLCSKHEQ